MDRILERTLKALSYQDPQKLLNEVMPAGKETNKQNFESTRGGSALEKRQSEEYQAALFASIMKLTADGEMKVSVCVTESADYDCILKLELDGITRYKQIQLKQLPPSTVNEKVLIQDIIETIKAKYRTSPELGVVMWINRDVSFDFKDLNFEGMGVEQFWIFGVSLLDSITLDGGIIADLVSGIRWTGNIKDGQPSIRSQRFRPATK